MIGGGRDDVARAEGCLTLALVLVVGVCAGLAPGIATGVEGCTGVDVVGDGALIVLGLRAIPPTPEGVVEGKSAFNPRQT